mmetsp:Transcript_76625/g.150209  ORF Transcript_76625/g.150209 Transcript_76625/m.150209 type:complete len:349 (+) Transcript_76625:177-1223(+)
MAPLSLPFFLWSSLAVRVKHLVPTHEDPPGGMWTFGRGSEAIQAWATATDPVSQGEVERVEIPGADGFAFVLKNCASKQACDALIAESERAGFLNSEDTPLDPRGRRIRCNGMVSWILGASSAEIIFDRVKEHLSETVVAYSGDSLRSSEKVGKRRCDGAPEGEYKVSGLNQRCRLYRYRAGSTDAFPIHVDEVWPGASLETDGDTNLLSYDGWAYGAKEKDPWAYKEGDRVSHMSFLLYLSSHDAGAGGETVLYLENGGSVRVSPVAGDALVFGQSFQLGRSDCDHSQYALRHEGVPMEQPASIGWFSGLFGKSEDSQSNDSAEIKYVLRTDVLYSLPTKGALEDTC